MSLSTSLRCPSHGYGAQEKSDWTERLQPQGEHGCRAHWGDLSGQTVRSARETESWSVAGEARTREWSHPRSWASPWVGLPSEGPSKESHSKVEASFLRGYPFHRQNEVVLRRWEWAPEYGVVSFYGLGNFILTNGRNILTILGERWGFPGIGPLTTCWSFMVGLGTVMVSVMAPVGMWFSVC